MSCWGTKLAWRIGSKDTSKSLSDTDAPFWGSMKTPHQMRLEFLVIHVTNCNKKRKLLMKQEVHVCLHRYL